MQLVEQHVIDRKDPRYGVIDEAAFRSKNWTAFFEARKAYKEDPSKFMGTIIVGKNPP